MTEFQNTKQNLETFGAMEVLQEIAIYQTPKDRYKYMDKAVEAMSSANGKAKLIQKLYDDVISKKQFDTRDIDNTMGNITKLQNYSDTAQAIDAINQLFDEQSSKTVAMLNDLHKSLISYRSDFEYAYKSNNDVLQSFYQVSVLTLMELINYAAAEYVSGLRDSVASIPGLTKKPGKKFLAIASKIVRVYASGNWTKLVNSYKRDNAKALKKVNYKLANEAFGDGITQLSQQMMGGVGFVQSVLSTGAGKFGTAIIGLCTIALATAAMFGIVALFLSAMRLAVYWFYSSSAKLSDYWDTQAKILEFNIEHNKANPNNDKKETRLRILRERVNFINAKILKIEKNMDAELLLSNREHFGAAELQEFNHAPEDDMIAYF